MNLDEFIYKEDSPQLAAYFEQFGKEGYISAEEINTIVDTLKLMSNNVTSSGFIEKKVHGLSGQNYTIAAFFKWAIDNELFSNLTPVSLAIPYSALGKTRYERIVANSNNTFVRVVGIESSSVAVLPDVPENTIELTQYLVRDNAVDAPVPAVNNGFYVEKSSFTPIHLQNIGTLQSLEMQSSAIKATGALVELGNIIKNNPAHYYLGQLFVFIDDTPAGNVKLPHMNTAGGTGSIAWFHPDAADYFTQKNEIVLFVFEFIGSQKVYRRISSGLRNKAVTLEKLQDIPSGTFFARNSSGIGQPELLDVFEVLLLLDLQDVVFNLGLLQTQVNNKQNTPRLVSANATALNNEILHITADATVTDIVDPVVGDFFTVRVLGGIATVGFVAYGLGTLITRNYNGTVWNSQVGGGVGGLRPELIFSEFKGDNYFSQVTPNSINNVGYNVNPTAVGSPQFLGQNIDAGYSSNPFDTSYYRRAISTTTAGSTSAFIWQIKVCRPSLGFYCAAKAGGDFSINSRNFFGLTESLGSIGNVNPSTVINTIGFGADPSDINLHIIHNDGSGVATKINLGANFPKAGDQIYILEMWNFFNQTSVYFRIKNLKLNIESEITEATTNLPACGLAFQLWGNNGTDTMISSVKFTNHSIKRQS